VVDTGRWLPGRKVLVAPEAVQRPDWPARVLPVNLTKEQVENSPPISTDEPVSRAYEADVHSHYGWVPYWSMAGNYTLTSRQTMPAEVHFPRGTGGRTAEEREEAGETGEPPKGGPNLRSSREVDGYGILAADGEIGHVEDFILDDAEWVIRYIVVDTRNWLPGRKVLVSPTWIDSVRWSERHVSTTLTRDEIKSSPEYDPGTPVNRAYEERLYDFYGRPRYWR
jgi:hypothetical protein